MAAFDAVLRYVMNNLSSSMMPNFGHYLGMDGAGQMQVERHLDFVFP